MNTIFFINHQPAVNGGMGFTAPGYYYATTEPGPQTCLVLKVGFIGKSSTDKEEAMKEMNRVLRAIESQYVLSAAEFSPSNDNGRLSIADVLQDHAEWTKSLGAKDLAEAGNLVLEIDKISPYYQPDTKTPSMVTEAGEKIIVNKNGQTVFEVYPDGRVLMVENYPSCLPGRRFLKNVHRETEVGNIGEEGYERIKVSPNYWALCRYNRHDFGYEFLPGICRDIKWNRITENPTYDLKSEINALVSQWHYNGFSFNTEAQYHAHERLMDRIYQYWKDRGKTGKPSLRFKEEWIDNADNELDLKGVAIEFLSQKWASLNPEQQKNAIEQGIDPDGDPDQFFKFSPSSDTTVFVKNNS